MRIFGRKPRNRIGAKRNELKNKFKRSFYPEMGYLKMIRVSVLVKLKCKFIKLAKVQSKLSRGNKANYLHDGSFHQAVGSVLVMAQCFTIMPVNNVKATSAAKLYFSWWSARTVYSCSVLVLIIFYNALVINWSFSNSIEFDKIVPVIFYTSNSFARVCFVILAMNWPALMMHWRKVEIKLSRYETIREQSELAHKIKMTSLIIMTLSLFEHLLSIISVVSQMNACNRNLTNPIEHYFRLEENQLFYYFEFSPLLAFIGKLMNVTSTFLWSYMDLFVIVISQGLSSRFEQINAILMKHKGQKMPELFWIKNRINYRNICRLCEAVDKAIGPITIVSFGNNLYFVCVQLMRSLKPLPTTSHAVYFWFSLTFLISRTLAVSLYSSAVNDQSKIPIRFFRACTSDAWCLEVKRFCDEVTVDTVALSGMKFFFLTRKLVLSIAGTIITYELVLIQFQKPSNTALDSC